MKAKWIYKTLIGVLVIGGGLGYFMLQAMQSSWAYYYSVDEFFASDSSVKDHSLRLAGRVKQGSVNRDSETMTLTFELTGDKSEIPVIYKGTVPDNFTEDIEIVVEGRLDTGGTFKADTLMTRCESKYEAKLD